MLVSLLWKALYRVLRNLAGGRERDWLSAWLNMESSTNSEKQPLPVGGAIYYSEDGNVARHNRRKSSTAKIAVERLVRTRERLWATTISATVAAIPALLVGYTLGYPSSTLSELTALPSDFRFSDLLASLFGAFAPVGALFGGPIAGWIADHWGRKAALLLAGIPYLVGYLMIALAHLIEDAMAFKTVLLIGRLLSGVGLGWSCMAVPVYHGEISSAKLRGIFGSFTQLFLALGLLIVYSVGSIEGFHYYNSALLAAGFTALFEVMMVWFSETPRWLLAKGYKSRAIAIIIFLRGPKVKFEQELKAMEVAISENTKLSSLRIFAEFKRRSVLIPFLIMAVIMFFQQIGGLNAISAYVAIIFTEANVPNPKLAPIYAVGATGLIATIVAVFLVDIVGRKVLLVVSGLGTLLGTTLLGTHFYITRPSLCQNSTNLTASLLQNSQHSTTVACDSQYAPLAIVGVLVYIALFSLGWGPIPWVLLGELLPLHVRGVASGIVTFVNWGTAAIVTGFYPQYSHSITPWFAWWSFSVLNLASVIFTIFCVYETKGKSLEELQQKFQGTKSRGPGLCVS